ncbi:hypothetical protein EP331_01010 [bacterium]|nr:MAG: hypothetical protein EP331_01010 [bacterium]
MKSILIVGCGWFGWPLAEFLAQKGFTIHGSTTTEDKIPLLKKNNIQAFLFKLTDSLEVIPVDALKSDYLIFNIPPGNNQDNGYNFSFEVRRLIQYIWLKNPKIKIIFISSTSVLDGHSGEVDENTASITKEGNGAVLAHLEQWLLNMLPNSTIVRFAGLYGEERHPAHYLSGKANIRYGSMPVNMTHLDDAIGATVHVLAQQIEGEILHVCGSDHPTRKEYYTKACERLNIDKPHFSSDDESPENKVILNHKLTQKYNYKLIRPSVYMGIV